MKGIIILFALFVLRDNRTDYRIERLNKNVCNLHTDDDAPEIFFIRSFHKAPKGGRYTPIRNNPANTFIPEKKT